jgi:hypothetical protein
VELENIILSKVSRAQKAKNHMFSPYRPKTITVILVDMGHMLRGECIHENRKRVGNIKLESV